MKCNVITIFPDLISHYCGESILARAQTKKLLDVNPVDLRDFTEDKHRTADDTPYGGGAGMVMKPEPMYKALKFLDAIPLSKEKGLGKLKKIFSGSLKKKKCTIIMSPRGRRFDQELAQKWSKFDELTIICGRYEGIDQRVFDHMVDEEISIGPYVLAGGELGALVIIEAVARLIPGVLGNPDSLTEETFGKKKLKIGNCASDIVYEYPQYTKPAEFMGWRVPDVLLSGDHKKIKDWKEKEMGKMKDRG